MSHVLLPVSGLLRRADVVEVIGAALEWKAAGAGHRRIADWLGRPVTTVRGWLRRFTERAGRIAAVFTGQLVAFADDPSRVLPEPAGSPFADALAAVIAAVMAVRGRLPVVTAPLWQVTAAVSEGLLLAPDWPRPTG
jgi:hypothetical protein